jgi:hypothetical protein
MSGPVPNVRLAGVRGVGPGVGVGVGVGVGDPPSGGTGIMPLAGMSIGAGKGALAVVFVTLPVQMSLRVTMMSTNWK